MEKEYLCKMLRNTIEYKHILYNNKKKIYRLFREKIAILSSFLVGVGQSESQFKRTNGPRFPRDADRFR